MTILDWSKLKGFADNKINVTEKKNLWKGLKTKEKEKMIPSCRVLICFLLISAALHISISLSKCGFHFSLKIFFSSVHLGLKKNDSISYHQICFIPKFTTFCFCFQFIYKLMDCFTISLLYAPKCVAFHNCIFSWVAIRLKLVEDCLEVIFVFSGCTIFANSKVEIVIDFYAFFVKEMQ